jgi:exoribonuclease R
VVSGVLRGGFFVEISDFLVDGFCFARDLDERYEFDEKKHRLISRRSRQTIQLGMAVRVTVAAVDWNALEMDLLLSESTETAGGKRKKQQGKGGRKKRR